jgi:hypothetical protein
MSDCIRVSFSFPVFDIFYFQCGSRTFNARGTAKCVHNLSDEIFHRRVWSRRSVFPSSSRSRSASLSKPTIQHACYSRGCAATLDRLPYETLANLHDSGYFPSFSNLLLFKSFSWPPKTIRDRNQLILCLVCTDKYVRNLVLGGESE